MSKSFSQAEKAAHYNRWCMIIVLAVILLTGIVRFRLLDVPLERDEGEHAYGGQLILRGIPPYAEVYNAVMPGIDVAYALIMAVFGQTCSGIRAGLFILNSVTIVLMFLLAKRLFAPLAGAVTGATFGLLSLGQWVYGTFAHTEHFVILFVVGGLLLLLDAIQYPKSVGMPTLRHQKRRYLAAGGLLFGLSLLMKQHGTVFIAFAGLYLFYCELKHRPFSWKSFAAKGVLFSICVLLPFVITCLVLWCFGVFGRFWFFAFAANVGYVSVLSLSQGLSNLWDTMVSIVDSAILIWILAGVGLSALWWNKKMRQHRVFIVGFLIFSFLAVCPGLYFREHYFIFLLPVISLLTAAGFISVAEIFERGRPKVIIGLPAVVLGLVVLFDAVYRQRSFFFIMDPVTVSRTTYGGNPFPESVEIARFIKERSTKDDRIVVIGSEPQIYFYSGRRAATGYIYTYPMMEDRPYARRMQEEMIEEVEAAKPKFLVFVNVSTSWLVQEKSDKMILSWFQQYQQEHYDFVGIVEITPERSTYRWEKDVVGYSPRSDRWLGVFRRRGQL